MKQLHYIGKRKFEWFQVEEPVIAEPHQAIAKPVIMGRCDADVTPIIPGVSSALAFDSKRCVDPMVHHSLGSSPYKPPFAVGHECVAEVLEVGREVNSVRPGDRVIVPWAISCGNCDFCNRNLTTHCIKAGQTWISGWGFGDAMGTWGGTVSDQILIPFADGMLTKVPSSLDIHKAVSVSDNLSDAWRTVFPLLNADSSQGVCILGGGAKSIGLFAAGLAVALGSPCVTYIDFDRSRLDIAETYGANCIQVEKTSKFGSLKLPNLPNFRIGIEAASSVSGFNFLFDNIECGGTVFGVGFYFFVEDPIQYFTMYGKSLTLKVGVSHPGFDAKELTAFLCDSDFDPRIVYPELHDYSDAHKLYGKPFNKLILIRN